MGPFGHHRQQLTPLIRWKLAIVFVEDRVDGVRAVSAQVVPHQLSDLTHQRAIPNLAGLLCKRRVNCLNRILGIRQGVRRRIQSGRDIRVQTDAEIILGKGHFDRAVQIYTAPGQRHMERIARIGQDGGWHRQVQIVGMTCDHSLHRHRLSQHAALGLLAGIPCGHAAQPGFHGHRAIGRSRKT